MNKRKVRDAILNASTFYVVTGGWELCCPGMAFAYARTENKVPIWIYMQTDKKEVPSLTSREVSDLQGVRDEYGRMCKDRAGIDYVSPIIYGTDSRIASTIFDRLNAMGEVYPESHPDKLGDLVRSIERKYITNLENAWLESMKPQRELPLNLE